MSQLPLSTGQIDRGVNIAVLLLRMIGEMQYFQQDIPDSGWVGVKRLRSNATQRSASKTPMNRIPWDDGGSAFICGVIPLDDVFKILDAY